MDINEKINYWIKLAGENFKPAQLVFDNGFYIDCCFYCHQTTEKILKAYFWFKNQMEPPYTHNLILLVNKSGLDNIIQEKYFDFLVILNPLNIQLRYPEDHESLIKSLTKEETLKILDYTREFMEWIETLIKK